MENLPYLRSETSNRPALPIENTARQPAPHRQLVLDQSVPDAPSQIDLR